MYERLFICETEKRVGCVFVDESFELMLVHEWPYKLLIKMEIN